MRLSKGIRYFNNQNIEQNEEQNGLLGKDNAIEIEELPAFLKTAGNSLDEKDISLMIHIIKSSEEKDCSKISKRDLYEVWGTMMYFSQLSLDNLILFIFGRYFEDRKELGLQLERAELTLDVEKVK